MHFKFNKVKNPVNEDVVVNPDERGSVTFTLRPINTRTAFACEAWRKNEDPTVATHLLFEIGASRIIGWKDVCDENGNGIEFTSRSFQWFCSIPEAIPYMVEVGLLTVEEVFKDEEKKMVKKDEEAS